jgi:hypothetical protein
LLADGLALGVRPLSTLALLAVTGPEVLCPSVARATP